MLSNFGEFLRRIDQFGASYKPSYAYGEAQYKTSLGGLLSIVLYGLSLAYLVYELILWREGKILPKVTSLQTEIETYSITFDQVTIASFCLRRHKSIEDQIDPFDPRNLILMPLLYEITDDVLGQPQPLLSTKKNEKHDTFMIEINNMQLQNNEHEQLEHPNIEYMLVFQSCVQNLLPEGWYCADENRVKQFFNQKQNQLLIQTFVNQYNTSTKQIDLVEQDYFAAFDNKTTYFSQVTVCTSNVSIDTGFLLESLEIVEFPSSLSQYVQQMDLDYFTHVFHDEIYVVFEFELGTLQQTVFIEYPKVSEVLANIGSIISFFLFFSHVAYMINEKTLELRVIRNLIEMYYPQMRNINFKKNFFGKIVEIKYKNTIINLSFLEHYRKLEKIAQAKLCLTNSLYEISRLQFIIRSICDKEVIKNCHTIGIKLKQLEFEQQENVRNVNQNENENENEFVLQQDKVENSSVQEINTLKINPLTTIDLKQQIVHFDQLNQSQSLFLGNVIKNQEQQDQENDLRLSDEDFYVLMQNQPKIKDLSLIEQTESVLFQQQQQTINLAT